MQVLTSLENFKFLVTSAIAFYKLISSIKKNLFEGSLCDYEKEISR